MKRPYLSFCSLILLLVFFLQIPSHAEISDAVTSSAMSFSSKRIGKDDISIETPSFVTKGKETDILIRFKNINHVRLTEGAGVFSFIVDGIPAELHFVKGEATLKHIFNESSVSVFADDFQYVQTVHFYPSMLYFEAPALLLVLVVVVRRRLRK